MPEQVKRPNPWRKMMKMMIKKYRFSYLVKITVGRIKWKQPTVRTRELRTANNILVGITERKEPITRLWQGVQHVTC
jgi:hypothetical protein